MVGIGLSFWPGLYALGCSILCPLLVVSLDEEAAAVASLLDETRVWMYFSWPDYTVVAIVGLGCGGLGLAKRSLFVVDAGLADVASFHHPAGLGLCVVVELSWMAPGGLGRKRPDELSRGWFIGVG
ncbi:hypothetical protein Nepgr_023044 [Nepenthes gracilis]|uniref:Uncharacterized protein n=1 Tax=Nepenthes gracilis TaxID=150966 RepID=A0AAD3T1X8_NEPGR|nr:hypothetical protein Nepgr_023044 [Nepenthes gracilis]